MQLYLVVPQPDVYIAQPSATSWQEQTGQDPCSTKLRKVNFAWTPQYVLRPQVMQIITIMATAT